MGRQCVGFGTVAVKAFEGIFSLLDLSEETKADLEKIGNKLGSACLIVEGAVILCKGRRQTGIDKCCQIKKKGDNEYDALAQWQGVGSVDDFVTLAGKIKGVDFSASLKFHLTCTAYYNGAVINPKGACNPETSVPENEEAPCADEVLHAELWAKVNGEAELMADVILPPGIPIKAGRTFKIEANIHMGAVNVGCLTDKG